MKALEVNVHATLTRPNDALANSQLGMTLLRTRAVRFRREVSGARPQARSGPLLASPAVPRGNPLEARPEARGRPRAGGLPATITRTTRRRKSCARTLSNCDNRSSRAPPHRRPAPGNPAPPARRQSSRAGSAARRGKDHARATRAARAHSAARCSCWNRAVWPRVWRRVMWQPSAVRPSARQSAIRCASKKWRDPARACAS